MPGCQDDYEGGDSSPSASQNDPIRFKADPNALKTDLLVLKKAYQNEVYG